MKKILKWTFGAILLLVVIFFVGPRSKFPNVNKAPITFDIPLATLDDYIADLESDVKDIKPGNEAQIVWADTIKAKTAFSVVYLHGFSASREEGEPIHRKFAERYGLNLYLPRLFDHGRKSENAFKGLTPEDLVNSAKEAIAIGKLLGDQVILMSCSTGGTFSAILASHDDAIHSLVMYSPNIDVFDPTSKLITGPWGKQMLHSIVGEVNHVEYNDTAKKYWSETYHTDGLIALKYLIEQEMNEKTFAEIDIPVFMGYYYKDEENQDKVVSVSRMLDFFSQVSTPEEYKRKIAYPNAERHVMNSYVFSKVLSELESDTYTFAEEVLNLTPKEEFGLAN